MTALCTRRCTTGIRARQRRIHSLSPPSAVQCHVSDQVYREGVAALTTIRHKSNAEEAGRLQYIIAQHLYKMHRLNAVMDADRAETEKIRAETRVIAAETRATLDNIETILTKLEAWRPHS